MISPYTDSYLSVASPSRRGPVAYRAVRSSQHAYQLSAQHISAFAPHLTCRTSLSLSNLAPQVFSIVPALKCWKTRPITFHHIRQRVGEHRVHSLFPPVACSPLNILLRLPPLALSSLTLNRLSKRAAVILYFHRSETTSYDFSHNRRLRYSSRHNVNYSLRHYVVTNENTL